MRRVSQRFGTTQSGIRRLRSIQLKKLKPKLRITPDTPCLVLTDGARVLGFARYSQFRGGDGYRFSVEHTINLHSDAHGTGAGRDLLDALSKLAKDAGKHTMYAGVCAENQGAVDFHVKVGFTIVAVLPEVGHKFGRWLDLVLMQKRL